MSSDWLPRDRNGKLATAKVWFAVLSEESPDPDPDGNAQTNAVAWGVPVDMVGDLGTLIGRCDVRMTMLEDPATATAVVDEECR
ncbi:MAG: hypothetical protein LBS82_05470, partial [Spirochaetaceae bacterium]|nr:hypothetical protein [Spirochaetaceae bacterium]